MKNVIENWKYQNIILLEQPNYQQKEKYRKNFTKIWNISLPSGLVASTPLWFVEANGNQSIPNATFTKLEWSRTIHDTDSAFSLSNNRFTVPSGKDGKYYVGASVQISGDMNNGHLGFRVNGGNPYSGSDGYGDYRFVGDNHSYMMRSYILNITAGDYVEIFWYNDGGTKSVYAGGRTNFFGYRIIE